MLREHKIILDTKDGKKIAVLELGGNRGTLVAPRFSAPLCPLCAPCVSFSNIQYLFSALCPQCAPQCPCICIFAADLEGVPGARPYPFSPKIYHKMLVKLQI